MEFDGLLRSNRRSDLLDAAPAIVSVQSPLTVASTGQSHAALVFIDAGVDNAAQLIASLQPGSEVHFLSSQDAVTQITETLLGRTEISSLHIVSHGRAGALQLGGSTLSGDTLSGYTTQLKTWAQALTADADILLYGCEVGQGKAGKRFIEEISQLTSADIAASSDLTGKGGNWTLEVNTGDIASESVFDVSAIAAYQGTLGDGVGGSLGRSSVSSDGRFVVFTSNARNLAASDSNNFSDVFLYDRQTDQVQLVSHIAGDNNQTGNDESSSAVISANGRYVAFVSKATNLVNGGTTDTEINRQAIYIWDRLENDLAQRTKLVSYVFGASSQRPDRNAIDPVISDNGEAIAFISSATNLDNIPNNPFSSNLPDIFYWRRDTNLVQLVSQTIDLTESRGVEKPIISGNGEFVAFASVTNNLVANDTNGTADVFRWNRQTGELKNITALGNGPSRQPDISFDGSRIAFVSQARNAFGAATIQDQNNVQDVFLWKDADNTIELISVTPDRTRSGTSANPVAQDAGATNPIISSDGKYVAFISNHIDLTNDNTVNLQQVFVRDIDLQQTLLVSRATNGGAATSAASNPSISGDGKRIVFTTTASNLINGDTNNKQDVFVRDLTSSSTVLISRDFANPNTVGNNDSGDMSISPLPPVISRDGSFIGFVSSATNLVENQTYSASPNIFLAPVDSAETTRLVSRFDGMTVSLAAVNTVFNEAGSPQTAYRLQRNKTSGSLTVKFQIDAASTASAADYTLTASAGTLTQNGTEYTLVMPDGVDVIELTLIVADDIQAEADETVGLSLVVQPEYAIAANANSGTVTIEANDTTVTNANDSGEGSLRQAILNANEFNGTQTIDFQIDNAGSKTINLATALPEIMDAVTIDGRTQSGFTNTPLIELNGNGINADGFVIDANDVAIAGLTIRNFAQTGIRTTAEITSTQILGNQIYNNSGLGIDIGSDGQTTSPVTLTRAQPSGGSTLINGTYTTTPNSTVRIDFFSSPTADASGFGEGQTFLGSQEFTADETGNVTINYTAGTIPLGHVVTATATTTTTTEFSNALAVGRPRVSISPATLNQREGDTGTTDLTFTLSLDQSSSEPITVRVRTANDTAIADEDYIAFDQIITFDPEQDQKTVTIQIKGDLAREGNETFSVNLSDPTNADLGTTSSATVTIADDDVTVSIQSIDQAEGNSGTTQAFNFLVSLSGATDKPINVTYRVVDGTASAGEDFTLPASQTLTFAPGETQKTIAIAVNADSKFEADENFSIVLESVENGAIAAGQETAIGTIRNDDTRPTITLRDITVDNTEGNTGDKPFTYEVELSNPSDETVTVSYTTVDGTATAANNDYELVSPTVLTFNPGETSKTFTVNVKGDLRREPDETFSVRLSNPTNATLGTAIVDSTIRNDDDKPAISIRNNSVSEGDSGQTTPLRFTVELSSISDEEVTIDYIVLDGTARTSDNDYVNPGATPTRLTFAPGETSKEISVSVLGDDKKESDETFNVVLQNPNAAATLGTASATGTILDNDQRPTVSIDGVSAPESKVDGQFVFNVQLSNPNDQPITVGYRTVDGTATIADNDYTATSGTLTFNPGETQKSITVNIQNDAKFELEEQFFVELFEPTNADLSANAQRAAGSLGNDDSQPTISIVAVPQSQLEGRAGENKSFTFEVNLSNPSGQTITVDFATEDGLAIAGEDYTANTGTLTFNPNETRKTITVLASGDDDFEPDEDFSVRLRNVTGEATLSPLESRATVTLSNDDQLILPTVSIDDEGKLEGGNGITTEYRFRVRLSKAPRTGEVVTVDYETQDGSATIATNDYSATSGRLTFAAGETEKIISVNVRGDDRFENDESFDVVLKTPTGAELSSQRDRARGFIRNDDARPVVSITGNRAIAEGAQGETKDLVFNVSIANSSEEAITVNYTTADGSARVSDNDYQATSGTLTFTPGQTQQSITVRVTGDNKFEPEETLTLRLTSAAGADLSAIANQGIGTILADDFRPTVSISGDAQAEGNLLSFPVRLSGASSETITVRFTTRNGSALDTDSDYVSQNGVITFLPGETEKTITLQTVGDGRYELDENFTVELSEPTNTTIAGASAIGTIRNDDPLPQIRVSAADSKREGDTGVTTFNFTVSLSQASPLATTVNYSTADGTATTANNDFARTSGSLTFAPGETQKTVTVTVLGDTQFEPNETFQLTLSNAVNATISNQNAIATIENDDRNPLNTSGIIEDGEFDVAWRNNQTGENLLWIFGKTLFGGSRDVLRVNEAGWEIEASADFDRDGDADILWRNYRSGFVILWEMNRDQVERLIDLPRVTDLGWRVKGVGDFNSDRELDIVWRNSRTGENSMWLMNNLNVSAGLYLQTIADTSWDIVGVGNVDNDSDSDLVWRNYRTGENAIWQIDNARLANGTFLPTVSDVRWVIEGVADFNGDRFVDLLWRNSGTGENSIWLLNETRFSSSPYLPNQTTIWQIEKIGDFNDDRFVDILWRNTTNDELIIWLMNGTSYGAYASLGKLPDRAWAIEDIGDFDVDRRLEVLLRNYTTGENAIWDVKTNTFQGGVNILPVNDPTWEIVGANDFDQDGQGDLLWRNASSGQNIIWFMNGDRIRELYSMTTVADLSWVVQGTGDLNGDVFPDIVWRNARTGETSVWFLTAGRYTSNFAYLPTVVDLDWRIEAVGELSGDRNADVFWRNHRTGDTVIWVLNTDGRSVARNVYLPTVRDLGWRVRGVGDFNNDGKLDLVWRNASAGETSFWLMNYTNTPTGVYLPSGVDARWDIAGVGDFNGDGISDLLWRDNTYGDNSIWYIYNSNYSLGVYLPAMNDLRWRIRGVEDFKGEAS